MVVEVGSLGGQRLVPHGPVWPTIQLGPVDRQTVLVCHLRLDRNWRVRGISSAEGNRVRFQTARRGTTRRCGHTRTHRSRTETSRNRAAKTEPPTNPRCHFDRANRGESAVSFRAGERFGVKRTSKLSRLLLCLARVNGGGGSLLRAGRAFLRCHGFEGTLPADLPAFRALLAEEVQNFGREFLLRHALILTRF